MAALFTLQQVLNLVTPEFVGANWKAVRHVDNRELAPDLHELYYVDRAALEFYQADQSRDVFGNCEGIFSFLGLPGRRALFIGAYRIVGKADSSARPLTVVPEALRARYEADLKANPNRQMFTYDLQRDPRFAPLEMSVVIDWGPGRLWHQWELDKPVVELRDPHSLGPCPDYGAFDVSLAKLAYAFEHEEANVSWRERLSSVGGIYLLTCHKTDRLYVGQAGGDSGFWGRWRSYAEQKSGNVAIDPAFASGELQLDSTSIAILEPIPRGATSRSLLDERETRWKARLRSRVTGFNRN